MLLLLLLQNRVQAAFDALPPQKQNKAKLAEYCGVRAPSANDWFSGKTKSLKASTLEKAAKYLNVSEKWLMDGTPPMERSESNDTPAEFGKTRIPLLNYLQAGIFTDRGINFDTEGMEYLLTDLALSERTFALQISGDSMTPEFGEGDRVIVDCDLAPQPGDFVVARNGGEEATFKRYKLISLGENEVFELVPLNENYPSMHSDQQHIQIIGVMVEHRKYRRRQR